MKIHRVLLPGLLAAMALMTSCADDPVNKPTIKREGVLLQLAFAPTCDVKYTSRAGESFYHEPVRNFGSENENTIDDATVVIYGTPLNEATAGDKVLKVIHMSTAEFSKEADLASAQRDVTLHYYNSGEQTVPGAHRLAYAYVIGEEFGKSIVSEILALGEGYTGGRDLYAMAFANINTDAKAYITAGLELTALRDYVYTGDLFVNEEIQYDADGNPWSKHPSVQKTDSQGNLLWDSSDPTKPVMWTPSKTGECEDGRDHVCYKDCHHFVMAAANEIRFNTKPVVRNIDGEDVDVVVVTDDEPLVVKRLAARIDMAFGEQAMWDGDANRKTTIDSYVKGSNPQRQFDVEVINDGTYLFPIYDEQYYLDHHNEPGYRDKRITGGLLKMWGIEMKNVADNHEYLIQRSLQGGKIVYFGTEGSFTDDYSAHFVPSAPNRGYKDYALARVDKAWNDEPFAKSVSPVGFIEPALFRHPVFEVYDNDQWPYAYYSIMGYFTENTFSNYSDANKYTSITIKANINISGDLIRPGSRGNADGSGGHDYHTAECIIPVKVTFPLRHSFGDAHMTDTGANMAYAIVRNTIYRIYIRFYAMGTDLVVRYYYYDGNQGSMTELPYPGGSATVNINPFIQESGGTAKDD